MAHGPPKEAAQWPTSFSDELAVAQAQLSAELVANWQNWVARRVTTFDLRPYEGVQVGHSVDYRLPGDLASLYAVQAVARREPAFRSQQVFLPMLLMPRRQEGMLFDVTNAAGTRLPLLDARGNQRLAVEALAQTMRRTWLSAGVEIDQVAADLATSLIEGCLRLASQEGTPNTAVARWQALASLRAAARADRWSSLRSDLVSDALLPAHPSDAARVRLETLVQDDPTLSMLTTYSLGTPVHVASFPSTGVREIVNLRWLIPLNGIRRTSWPVPQRTMELPVQHLGGCESQHIQVRMEQDVAVLDADLWTELETAQESVLTSDVDVSTATVHVNVRSSVSTTLETGGGWLVYNYTTARTAIALGLAAIGVACFLLTAVAASVALAIEFATPVLLLSDIDWGVPAMSHRVVELPPGPARPTQSLTSMMVFVAGLLGVLTPQLSLGPHSRRILEVTVRRLSVTAGATIVAGALLATADATQNIAPPVLRNALLAGLVLCAVVSFVNAIAPARAAWWIIRNGP